MSVVTVDVAKVRLIVISILNSNDSRLLPVAPLCEIVLDYYGHTFLSSEFWYGWGKDAYMTNIQIIRNGGHSFLFSASQRDQLIGISEDSFNFNFGQQGGTTCNADPLPSASAICVFKSGTILTVGLGFTMFIKRLMLHIGTDYVATLDREGSTGRGWVTYFHFFAYCSSPLLNVFLLFVVLAETIFRIFA